VVWIEHLERIKKNKIPCYVLIYYCFDNFKKSMESLFKKSAYLDIKVIENYSKYTEAKIKPYVMDLLQQGLISEYFLFDANIANNATHEVLLRLNYDDIKSPYMMITDGDLVFKGDWLEEEIGILSASDNIYAVGTSIDESNLPNIAGAELWVAKKDDPQYKYISVAYTGMVGLLMRSKDVCAAMEILTANDGSFYDLHLHKICSYKKKLWVRTKINNAYHLTWDNYMRPNDEYGQWKLSTPYEEVWKIGRKSDYTIYTKNTVECRTME